MKFISLRSLIKNFDENYNLARFSDAELVLQFAKKHWLTGYTAALIYLQEIQANCESSEDADQLDIAIELLSGELESIVLNNKGRC